MRHVSTCATAILLVACIATVAAQEGVSKFKLTLGQSVPLSGPAAEIGLETRIGAQLYFDEINSKGGVFGRDIELKTLDDANDPARAERNAAELIESDQVLALFGLVGTPSAKTIALAARTNVPVFGTLSGDQGLRNTGGRNVFNLRASYNDEIKKLVETLTTIGQTRFAVFLEDSAFGAAGLVAAVQALRAHKIQLVASAGVKPDSTDVKSAAEVLFKAKPDAILMIASYASASALVKHGRHLKTPSQFHAISLVGGKILARTLGEAAHGVSVSQVVPSPFSPSVAVVREYQTLMKKSGKADFSFTSLEGYIAAKVLVEALRRAGKDVTRDKLIEALTSLNDYDAGGFRVSFSTGNRNNLNNFVELTLIGRGGTFLK